MILLTGASGQLGQELLKHHDYLTPTHAEMDLTDPDAVQMYLGTHSPDLIVHAAAYTDTLKPDRDPQEAAKCFAVNVLGTRNLVNFAVCPIIYISTESAVHPYNFYILTKLQGENEVALHKYGYRIIRTSFRCDPFEYPKAAVDMYTMAGTVAEIAALFDVNTTTDNTLSYLGTGVKTVYELAYKSRPDVIAATRAEISPRLPEMTELLHV